MDVNKLSTSVESEREEARLVQCARSTAARSSALHLRPLRTSGLLLLLDCCAEAPPPLLPPSYPQLLLPRKLAAAAAAGAAATTPRYASPASPGSSYGPLAEQQQQRSIRRIFEPLARLPAA